MESSLNDICFVPKKKKSFKIFLKHMSMHYLVVKLICFIERKENDDAKILRSNQN